MGCDFRIIAHYSGQTFRKRYMRTVAHLTSFRLSEIFDITNWCRLWKDMDSIADDLIDFLECVIHSFLFARKIYPSNLFEQRKYLEVTVWQSRHPDINAYIRRVLDNARPLIAEVIIRECYHRLAGRVSSSSTLFLGFVREWSIV